MDAPLPTTPIALSTTDSTELEELLRRQSDGWSRGQPTSIEDLINGSPRTPQLTSAQLQDWRMALISNEIALRERAGQRPSLEEYQQRFSDLSEALSIQWQFDRLLEDRDHRTVPFVETLPAGEKGGRTRFPLPRHIGQYEVLAELGRGATGVVYKAWDPHLKRLLAIKRLREGSDADLAALARMFCEAEAIARIDHPNIVKIFEVVVADGLPVLAMEYCDGGPLSKRLDGTPIAPKVAAEITLTIAQAVAAVHQSRMVHRDLKPANVLLTSNSQWNLKVSDFGLAKLLDADSGATATGSILGTPAYMAPEQAFGDAKHVGAAADIYSVGAILYECLTGLPPFRGATVADTLEQVRNRDPLSIRQLALNVPIDLETIALKCMRKNPAERYPNMQSLVEDLGRYLEGHPIAARPLSWMARGWRSCRRDPRTASLLASVLALLCLTILILFDRNLRIRTEVHAKSVALQQRTEALTAKESALEIAAANELLARKRFYAAEMNLAQQAFEQGETARVLELLEHQRPGGGQLDLRGFEWDYLYKQIHQRLHRSWSIPHQAVNGLAFSPNGRWLAVCSGSAAQSQVAIWDVESGAQSCVCLNAASEVAGVVFSPDSRFLMYGLAHSGIGIWDVEASVLHTKLSTPNLVHNVTWCADSRWIAAGDCAGGIHLWNAKTHEAIPVIQAEAEVIYSLLFSNDGRRLYVGRGLDYDKTHTQEYNLEQFPLLAPHKIENVRVHDITDDGQRLLCVRWGEVYVQQRATNRVIWSDTVTSGSVSAVQFAGDERRFARSGNSDRAAEIWNVQTGQVEARIAHLAPVNSVVFDPLNRYWATGSEDGVVSIWRDEAIAPLQAEPFHLPVWRIALTDQDELFLGGPFPVEVRGTSSSKQPNVPPIHYVRATSKDGRILLAMTPTSPNQNSATTNPSVSNDIADKMERPPRPPTRRQYYFDSPPLGLPETIEIWDRDGFAPRLRFRLPDQESRAWRAIALDPNGKMLAARQWDGPVRVWDISGTLPQQIVSLDANCLNLSFSMDGRYLAACCEGNRIRVWELPSAQVLPDFVIEESVVKWAVTAQFSRDGKYLAGGNGSGVVRVWEVASGKELSRFTARIGEIHSLAFFPNSRTLAVAGIGPISLWAFETGQELLSLPVPDYKIYQVIVSADGRSLVACSDAGIVRRWQTGND